MILYEFENGSVHCLTFQRPFQFHLPEGKPDAQVFDGMITLVYEDLEVLMDRYNDYLDGDERFAPLRETEFLVGMVDEMMLGM